MSEPNDEAQMPNNKGKTKKEARESHEQTQKKSGRKTSFALIRVIRGQICFLCLIRLHSQLKCKSQHFDRG